MLGFIILILLPYFSLASRLASRQSLGCGSQPVDCGRGWCCLFGEICQATPDNQFMCIDTILTSSDGYYAPFNYITLFFLGRFSNNHTYNRTPFTHLAENPSSGIAQASSLNSAFSSLTIGHTLPSSLSGSDFIVGATPSATRSSSSLVTAKITSSNAAVPSTIVPTSGVTKVMEIEMGFILMTLAICGLLGFVLIT